ncbi:hypothetical protein D3C85_1017620 [compost metagenome]
MTNAVGSDRLQALDLTEEKAQQVDVVDQVDQHRAAARLSTPRGFEVFLWFEPGTERSHADRTTQQAGVNDGLGLAHDRVVATLVTDECRYAIGRSGSTDSPSIFQGIGDRFFHQHRDFLRETVNGNIGMSHVGCRHHNAARLGHLQHRAVVLKPRHPQRGR